MDVGVGHGGRTSGAVLSCGGRDTKGISSSNNGLAWLREIERNGSGPKTRQIKVFWCLPFIGSDSVDQCLSIGGTAYPLEGDQGISASPLLDDGILVPLLFDVGVLGHNDLQFWRKIRSDVPEQLEQSDDCGAIRIFKVRD